MSHAHTPSFEQYLLTCAVSREAVHCWLEHAPRWAEDSELGCVERNYTVPVGSGNDNGLPLPGGIDGSTAIITIRPDGARNSFMYADRPCRINTYGDSFTHGDQVNDGECWQEYLAAHLCEPIRNFGVGGYGVHQAYRRMLREERSEHGAHHVILYIWGDDSIRSLFRSWFPLARLSGVVLPTGKPNVEIDFGSGRFVERENPLPTVESMYQLTDAERIVELFRGDLALQLELYRRGAIRDVDRVQVGELARLLDFSLNWDEAAGELETQIGHLLDRYAQRASVFILDKARAFVHEQGKKLLVILFDPSRALSEMHRGVTRHDAVLVEHLVQEGFDYVDVNDIHLGDFESYRVSLDDYLKQFFVDGKGHYNPRGNHFFAYAIKDTMVQWLKPTPINYQPMTPLIDFDDYLFNGRLARQAPYRSPAPTEEARQ